jgi:hypothetical protein
LSGRRLLTFVLIFVAVMSGLLAFRFFRGTHTPYCPLSHKFSDTADCIILHVSNGRILIRHRDSFTKESYFEIIDHGRSYKFEIPEYNATGSKRNKFRVRLIDKVDTAVTINGVRYDLLPIQTGSRGSSNNAISRD